jgi:hypothetical protein
MQDRVGWGCLRTFVRIALAWMLTVGSYAQTPSSVDSLPAQAGNTRPDPTELVELGTRGELRAKFLAANPMARHHQLNMRMNAYDDRTPAGLRLNSIWVAPEATMVEFEGLPIDGGRPSAVIHENTFVIQSKGRIAALQAAEGVSRIKDRDGGDALLIQPGQKLLAIFGAIDDYHPFSISHRPRGLQEFVYFQGIDPRFSERYAQSAQKALATDATPEQMRDFIAEFAKNDPQGKVREVFVKLVQKMRAQNTFEGFYAAYSLLREPNDARAAIRLARSDEHRASIEHMAVLTLEDKSRLIDFSFQVDTPKITADFQEPRGGFWGMGKEVVREAHAAVSGVLRANLVNSRPIPLRFAAYDFKFRIRASAPQKGAQGGWFVSPPADEVSASKVVSVRLGAGSSTSATPVNVGKLPIAYLDRGTRGGFTARWLKGDAMLTVELISVEPVK